MNIDELDNNLNTNIYQENWEYCKDVSVRKYD